VSLSRSVQRENLAKVFRELTERIKTRCNGFKIYTLAYDNMRIMTMYCVLPTAYYNNNNHFFVYL